MERVISLFQQYISVTEKVSKDTTECPVMVGKEKHVFARSYTSSHPQEAQVRMSNEDLALLFLSFFDRLYTGPSDPPCWTYCSFVALKRSNLEDHLVA